MSPVAIFWVRTSIVLKGLKQLHNLIGGFSFAKKKKKKQKQKHNSLLTYIVTSKLCYALEEHRLNGIFFFSNLYLDLHFDMVVISFI